jgi:hypothetical protein
VNNSVTVDTQLVIGQNNITFQELHLNGSAQTTITVTNGTNGAITILGCGNLGGTLTLNVTDITHSQNVTLFQYPTQKYLEIQWQHCSSLMISNTISFMYTTVCKITTKRYSNCTTGNFSSVNLIAPLNSCLDVSGISSDASTSYSMLIKVDKKKTGT